MAPAGTITALEVHADGEPGRVIIDGVPDVPGASMFEKMQYLRARVGQMIRAAAAEQLAVAHPDHAGHAGISIAQLSGRSRNAAVSRRNAVVITTGELDWARPETWRGVLDRSPCGTGTCAKMAVLHARGELALQQDFRHEGILDTVWTGRLLRTTHVGDVAAVVPRITGRGWIYGRTQYPADAQDPFPQGFTVADIWARGG